MRRIGQDEGTQAGEHIGWDSSIAIDGRGSTSHKGQHDRPKPGSGPKQKTSTEILHIAAMGVSSALKYRVGIVPE